MARDGLIEIRDASGAVLDPATLDEAPDGSTWVLTPKGSEYLARTLLGEQPDRLPPEA